MKTVIDTHTMCNSTEANKTVLEHLKIDFKEVESKKSKTKYLRLLRHSDIYPDQQKMIEELDRCKINTYYDDLLKHL